ncbi:MAG: ABC transporter ATP-binding protein [Clostridiales bacterium]|nr:ABC transporter ATP-binding protein [Clostridiales bacterium]MBD9283485.1 ABC transporter ATP-binding protein [Clostridiales bacterium]
MKHLYPYLRRFRKESILAPLFKMLEATFDLLVPMVVADIIKVGIAGGDTTYIWTRCGLLVLMALIGLLCSFTAQYFAARAAIGTSTGLRHELMAHIQSLSFSELDTLGVSTLITRMTSDVNQVQNGLNMFLRLFLRSPFIVAGAMIAAFTIDTQIALIFLAAIPVLAVIVFGIMRITSPMYKTVQSRLDAVTGATRENLSGVRVVRAFGREDAEEENFVQQNGSLNAMQLKVGRIAALMNPLTYVVVNLGIIGILYFGANKIGSGALLSGDVVALVNYMSQILVELVKLANLVVLLTRAIASMGRVSQVLDTPSTMAFPEKPVSADAASDVAVAFDHVSLRYQGAGAESLSDVTFTAKKGQTIGVIGGTGSGKTTLVSLIPRFYDATKGQVTLLGQPITAYSKEELNRHVAVVMQKAQLFKGTIRSNLLWGNENATDEELWHALSIAQSEDFVRQKPGKLDDPVEQGGRNLSGGQRQRLTIARALVGHPDILILDDSASALDYATDAALRKALRTLPAETTLFIVSQRTSSLRHADQIIVLDDGHVVGIGTHDALMQTCKVYREIHESQFRKGSDVQ